MRTLFVLASALAAALPLLLQCSSGGEQVAGGNTSEVGNGAVIGVVLCPDGSRASGARVRAVPVDYRPEVGDTTLDTFPEVQTDSGGQYLLDSLDVLVYNIEAEQESLAVMVDSVAVLDDVAPTLAPDAVLQGAGAITGVTIMENMSGQPQRLSVYLVGTDHRALPDQRSYEPRFLFEYVAAGNYQLVVEPWLSGYYRYMFDVTVVAGNTVDMDTIWVNLIR
jgi:hypothetical protein